MTQNKQRNRCRWLLAALLSLIMTLGGASPAWADELTVHDGTATSSYLPLYGYYVDSSGSSEFIIPSSDLADLNGKEIEQIIFYLSSPAAQSFGAASFKVYLEEVTASNYDDSSASLLTDSKTLVYVGALDATKSTMEIPFSTNYTYHGGNLLIAIEVDTKGTYKSADFYGTTTTSYAGRYKYGSSSAARAKFIPKTTFVTPTKGPALTVKDGSTKITSPYAYDFGLTTAGTTHTFTLSNPGTAAVEGLSVSETGSFDAELSATSIAAGGEATLTITMPATTGNSTITVSSSTAGIDDFVINASGTVKDPAKIYIDFDENALPDAWSFDSGWSVNSTNHYATISGTSAYIRSGKITSEGEDIIIRYKGNSTWISYGSSYYPTLAVYSATTGNGGDADWTQCGETLTGNNIGYNEWHTTTFTIPSTAKYIAILGKYLDVDFVYGLADVAEPKMKVTQPASLDFGIITEATAKTFTIANTGKATLEGISVTSSNNTIFAISDAPSSLAAGASQEVTITMAASTTGALSSDIKVNATGMDEVTFTVSGAVMPAGAMTVDFVGELPANWSNSGLTHDKVNGTLSANSYSYYLTTPKLTFAAGDFIVIKARRNDADTSDKLYVYGSADNGATWNAYSKTISGADALTQDWATIVLSDIPTSVNKLRFACYYATIDDITGLTYAPVLAVTKDEAAVTSPDSYDFGECAAVASVTYHFANSGAGTINITGVEITGDGAAAYTTDWTTSVAAPFDLTITRSYDAARNGVAQEAVVTVTTSEGTFVINVTGTDQAANQPKMDFYVGGDVEKSAAGAALSYGMVALNTAKSLKIKNDGTGALSITAVTVPDGFALKDGDAVVNPSVEAPLTVAAGAEKTLSLAITAYGVKSGTLTFTAADLDDFSFNVSGTAYDATAQYFNFDDRQWPTDWLHTNGSITYETYGSSNYYYEANGTTGTLTTSKVTVTEGEMLIFQAKKYYSSYTPALTIAYAATSDAAEWTTLATLNGDNITSDSNWDTFAYTIPAGDWYVKFTAQYVDVDNVYLFHASLNDPKVAVFSDAEATAAVAAGTTKDFGWAQTAQTATYYIKNGGTGTLTITDVEAPEGFTTTAITDANRDITTGALAFDVTMTNAAIGAKSGTVTIKTNAGDFAISVQGFVYGDRNLVDFTDAAQYTGWTGVSVSSNAASLSSTAIQTTQLKAQASERLYVEILGSSSYTSKSFSYSYSADNGETWSDAVTLVASTYSTVADQIFTISDIADTEADRTVLVRFTGAGLSINRIYGFEAIATPVMTTDATASHDFGMQTAAADYVITVTNTGTGDLTNLAAALTGDDAADYDVAVSKTTVPFTGENTATVTVTLKASTEYKAHNATLTITADDVAEVVVNLTGKTRDGSKSFADFQAGMPDGWTTSGWSRTYTGSNYYAQAGYSGTNTLTTPALTIAAGEEIKYDAWVGYAGGTFKVRYTTNGGISWTEADVEATTTQTTKTLSLGNETAVTAYIQFVGDYYARIDNFYGGSAADNAPMIQVKKSSAVVENGVTEEFGTILETATTTYTITNIGSGTLTITEPVGTTGEATAGVSATSLAAGESATLTITMPVAAPYGDKAGTVTVTTSLGDFVINYTATTMDPDALNETFSSYTLPDGWYANGWSYNYTQYMSRSDRNSDADFITQKLTVAGEGDVLKFDAQKYGSYYESNAVLKVSYSTDRVNWTETDYTSELTTSWNTFEISGLPAGEYYLKFTGRYANVDNIIGWKKVAGIEHDLYVTTSTFPATTEKGSNATISATVTSLRQAETGVYAKLFVDDEAVELTASPATADISLRGTQTFTFTYAIPENKTAQVKVYFSDDTEAFATATADMKVTYTLDEATDPGTIDRGEFDVTLKRTLQEGWNSLCLPFAVADVETVFGEGAKVYEFKSYTADVLTFETVEGNAIVAGTPYLIKMPAASSADLAIPGANITAPTAGEVVVGSVTFKGTYAPMAAPSMDGKYAVNSANKIAKGTATASMDGFRGYFEGNLAGARIAIVDDVTGITTVYGDARQLTNDRVYNLSGQQVQHAKKGVFIVDGKKVVVK